MKRTGLEGWLAQLGLLRAGAEAVALPGGERPEVALLRLCEAGALAGGLSVALGVRPDELVGPLTQAMGGTARRLKVLDVRERPGSALELHVLAGELSERWEVEDVAALVHNLNDLYRAHRGVAAVAVLGEWEDALQLWCVGKGVLGRLLREPFFRPHNARVLAALLEQQG